MRKFEINFEQLQTILNILGEVQAKIVLPVIDIIRNLPEISENAIPSDNKKSTKDKL